MEFKLDLMSWAGDWKVDGGVLGEKREGKMSNGLFYFASIAKWARTSFEPVLLQHLIDRIPKEWIGDIATIECWQITEPGYIFRIAEQQHQQHKRHVEIYFPFAKPVWSSIRRALGPLFLRKGKKPTLGRFLIVSYDVLEEQVLTALALPSLLRAFAPR